MKMVIFISLVVQMSFLQAQTGQTDAKKIVEKSYNLFLGKSSFSVMKMTIVRPTWKRTISMQNWSMGDDYYITYITAPARDKGQVFLKNKKDMWNYVPAINRTIKIPPSMMMQSWMGSDFTNNDLMKQKSIITDYSHKITGSETLANHDCYVIELTPLPDAAVVWGKIIMWIDKKSYIALRIEYYDTHGKKVKTETASEIKNMGGRLLPSHMEMISDTKEGHKTVIDILHQEFDIKEISPSFFSIQNIKRLRPRKF
jgi:outer membrane lipoprotein-sorting protein